MKSKSQIKEEEDEKRAAELEKKKRAAAGAGGGIGIGSSPSSALSEPPLRRYKLLLLGDSGVGKSSLICRWTQDTFTASITGTVGVDFKVKKVALDGDHFQIQVWDTAGQEQFHKITTSYYRGANGIMLVYDVTDEKSATEVSYWMKNIKTHAAGNVAVVMVGNKADLLTTKDSPILTAGKNNAKKYEVPHFITSAKDSSGVDDAFLNLVRNVIASDAQIKPKSHLAPHVAAKAAQLAPEKSEKQTTGSSISAMFKGRSKGTQDPSAAVDSKFGVPDAKGGKEKCRVS
jgi:small GTP-binding protein